MRAALLVVASVLTLAGCASPTPTAPVPTAPPSAAPDPTAAPLDPVAELVLTADTVQVLDGFGSVVLEKPLDGWDDDLTTLLTSDLGDPEVTEFAGGGHDFPARTYLWGETLSVVNVHGKSGESTLVVANQGLPDGIDVRT